MDKDAVFSTLKSLAKSRSLDFDFLLTESDSLSIVFRAGGLSRRSFSDEKSLKLRLIQDGKSGVSYAAGLSPETLKSCFAQALTSLEASDGEPLWEPAPYFPLRSAKKARKGKDPGLSAKIDLVRALDASARKRSPRIQSILHTLQETNIRKTFAGSQGMSAEAESFVLQAYSESLADNGKGGRGLGRVGKTGSNYDDIKDLGRISASEALAKADFSIPHSGGFPVLFRGDFSSPILLEFLLSQFNGQNIADRRSRLKVSDLKQKIFDEKVTVLDDPFASWSFENAPFDEEGYASQKTFLVEKGVVKNYLTNSFLSKKLKTGHTAKAIRLSNGKMSAGASAVEILPGKEEREGMEKAFPEIVEVDFLKGMAGWNPVSGDFSIEAEGFLWRHGKRERALAQFTVSGNVLQLFKNLEALGSESFVSAFGGAFKAPSLLLKRLSVAGK